MQGVVEGKGATGGAGGAGGNVDVNVNARGWGRGGDCTVKTETAFGGTSIKNGNDHSEYSHNSGSNPKAANGTFESMTIGYAFSGTNSYTNESDAVWVGTTYGGGGKQAEAKIENAHYAIYDKKTANGGKGGWIKIYFN